MINRLKNKLNIKLIFLSVVSFCLLLDISLSTAEDRIIAIVNDEFITESELKDKNDFSYIKLSYLIEKKLQLQTAKKRGITVQQEEIPSFKEIISEEEKKEAVEQLTIFKLLNKDIKSRISINDKELEEYYILNKELFILPEEVRVGYVFIPIKTSDSPENINLSNKKINNILSDLKINTSLKDISMRYNGSIDVQIIDDLGAIKRGDLLKELDIAAFSLREGEISDVIYTSSGFYILKVLEKKSLKYKTFEDLTDLIREKVFQEKSEKLYKEWIYNIKTSSFIELRI
ncbi:MAG: hypothetical protein A2Z60_03105 [Nitrospirae bacterium RIFCSPLOWO2_02_42_7]|nr:MAG: hypothetical protein A2Z60_03105 [Nitrospirae bacterium RIFCSPLOWO2_02_42_7]